MHVEYQGLDEYPGYRFGSDGSIWSCHRMGPNPLRKLGSTWRQMRVHPKKVGTPHLEIGIMNRDGKKITRFVHKLIIEAFLGPCPKGMLARHFPDRDPANNHITNLRYGTAKQNAEDRDRDGKTVRGEKHHRAKITDNDVREIRAAPNGYGQIKELCDKYGLDRTVIWQIRKRKIWTHVE